MLKVIRKVSTCGYWGDSSSHFYNDRYGRNRFIEAQVGWGKPIAAFECDKQHMNGREIHVITTTGLIMIYNEFSGKLATVLIARPGQIKRYYDSLYLRVPQDVYDIARQHAALGYNNA